MKVLGVNQSEVAKLLPMAECIEAMAQALLELARGETAMPLRQVMPLADRRAAGEAAGPLESSVEFPATSPTRVPSCSSKRRMARSRPSWTRPR